MASPEPLAQYLESIRSIPLLTADQERKLAIRYRAGDKAAGDKLVTSNLRFVVSIAKEYGYSGLPLLDLIQEGNVGLMRAVVKFDPRRKLRLCTYALWWVHAMIGRYLQRQRSMVATQKPIGCDLSLDMPVSGDSDDTHIDLLTDGLRVDDQCIDKESATIAKERILRALTKLTPNERLIITLRRLGKEKITLEDVGLRIGLTRERVRQIELKTMKKLENILQFDGMSEPQDR